MVVVPCADADGTSHEPSLACLNLTSAKLPMEQYSRDVSWHSESYVGGHVEASGAGVFRSDDVTPLEDEPSAVHKVTSIYVRVVCILTVRYIGHRCSGRWAYIV